LCLTSYPTFLPSFSPPIPPPPRPTLFPYTTLFRSGRGPGQERLRRRRIGALPEPLVHAVARDHLERDLGRPLQVIGGSSRHLAVDRKSTRLYSSHLVISYAVFCLKKKNSHKI